MNGDLPVSLETSSERLFEIPRLWRRSSSSSGSASSSLIVSGTLSLLTKKKL